MSEYNDEITNNSGLTPFNYFVEEDGFDDEIENRLTAYDIAVFYNTYNLDTLMKWWGKRLVVPIFQRSFVWNHKQASEFVDTILRGLPVPTMFFYDDRENSRYLVVDGLQRLTSLHAYIKDKSIFGKEFKLVGNIHPNWKGKTYDDLNEEDRDRLDDALINITLMRQLAPDDERSAMYLAFQRINTGGVTLKPQEIRMAVSYGKLAVYLDQLSQDPRFDRWPFLQTENEKKNFNYSKIQEFILKFWAYYFSYPDFAGGTTRNLLDSFFDENKNFEITNKTDNKKHYKKEEFENAFNAAFDIVNSLSLEDISPYSKPTQTFLESIWVGITYRILKLGKEVNVQKLPSYIANWRNVIGDEEFEKCFQARRTSSLQSAFLRIKAGIDYFSGDI